MTAPHWVRAVLDRSDADTVLTQAREWLEDRLWLDMDLGADTVAEAVADLTETGVLAMVDTHYGGGLDAFLQAVTA